MCRTHTGPGPCNCLIAAAHRSIGDSIRAVHATTTDTAHAIPADSLTATTATLPADLAGPLVAILATAIPAAVEEEVSRRDRHQRATRAWERAATFADQVAAENSRRSRLRTLRERMDALSESRSQQAEQERQHHDQDNRAARRMVARPSRTRARDASASALTAPVGSWYSSPRPPTSAPIMCTRRGHGFGWA